MHIRTNILSIAVLNVALLQALKVIQYVDFKDVQTAISKQLRKVYIESHLTVC